MSRSAHGPVPPPLHRPPRDRHPPGAPAPGPGCRRRCCRGCSSPAPSTAVEDVQDFHQAGADVLYRLACQRGPGCMLDFATAPRLVNSLPGALDGVFLGVQEVLDQLDELHFAGLVDPVAGTVLGRTQEAELTFPVAQHVRLEAGERTDVADGEELLPGG